MSGIQMNLGPQGTHTGSLTDANVVDIFSISVETLVILLGTDNHPLVRLRKKPNQRGTDVDPTRPMTILRNNFGTPVEVYNP